MAAPPIPHWQAQILKGIGAPVTPQNLLFLNDWARAEGGSAANNPFNTTQGAPGATAYNSNGGNPVKNYTSPLEGLSATVQTLKNGRYGNILGALKQGTSAQASAQALAASPWGTGSLVLKMLGGGAGGAPAAVAPAGRGIPTPTPPQRGNPNGSNLAALIASTNQNLGLDGSPMLEQLLASRLSAPATSRAPAPPIVGGAPHAPAGPGGLTTVGGVQVDSKIVSPLEQIIRQFGVHPTSGYRDAAHNSAVGGAQNSDHLRGDAVDFGGNPQQLAALYRYAQGRYPYVEPRSQSGPGHVHVSFRRP